VICSGCQNQNAYALLMREIDGKKVEFCNRCGQVDLSGTPDVYFKNPYWDENISSEEHPGPKFISSRREKKYWLDKCHLREAGDRVHGASSFDKISHRHAMESLRRR